MALASRNNNSLTDSATAGPKLKSGLPGWSLVPQIMQLNDIAKVVTADMDNYQQERKSSSSSSA